MACRPDQDKFLYYYKVGKTIYNKVEYNVGFFDEYFDVETICEVYKSCTKVPEIAESTSNSYGFLQFFSDNGIPSSHMVMNLTFSSDPVGDFVPLKFEVIQCNNTNGSFFDFNYTPNCSCTYCNDACGVSNITVVFPSFFNGFSFVTIVITYLILLVVGIVYFFIIKVYYRKAKSNDYVEVNKQEEVIKT